MNNLFEPNRTSHRLNQQLYWCIERVYKKKWLAFTVNTAFVLDISKLQFYLPNFNVFN